MRGEIPLEHPLVNARQGLDVRDRDPLVDRVDGRVRQAEVDDRAGVLDEAGVGRAAAGRKGGRRPVTSSTAPATRSVKAPRGVRKATALVGSKASV